MAARFPGHSCERAFDLSKKKTNKQNSENTKKATEIFLNVFRQYQKERELDEEQFGIEGKLRFRLHHFSKKARGSHFPFVIVQTNLVI